MIVRNLVCWSALIVSAVLGVYVITTMRGGDDDHTNDQLRAELEQDLNSNIASGSAKWNVQHDQCVLSYSLQSDGKCAHTERTPSRTTIVDFTEINYVSEVKSDSGTLISFVPNPSVQEQFQLSLDEIEKTKSAQSYNRKDLGQVFEKELNRLSTSEVMSMRIASTCEIPRILDVSQSLELHLVLSPNAPDSVAQSLKKLHNACSGD